jgi:hypothetical protein
MTQPIDGYRVIGIIKKNKTSANVAGKFLMLFTLDKTDPDQQQEIIGAGSVQKQQNKK